MNIWRTIKIFISSTFIDMDSERDALRLIVEPQLNNYFKSMHLNIRFIDLRKDVETDTSLPVEEREKQILQVCIKEIEDCSPFFIGLVGDRYGWIPPEHLMDAYKDAEDEGNKLPDVPFQKSVTCYEFLKGAFFNGKISPAALVYMRTGEHSDNMDENLVKFRTFLKKAFAQAGKPGALKEYSLPLTTTGYAGDNNAPNMQHSRSNHINRELLDWSQQVYNDLVKVISNELNISQDREYDIFHQINTEQEDFIHKNTHAFYGRDKELHEIDNCIAKRSECLIVSDSTWMGTSALICSSYKRWEEKEGTFCLFHSTQASERAHHTNEIIYRWCYLLEKELGYIDLDHLHGNKENTKALTDLLIGLCQQINNNRRNVIIFIDKIPVDAQAVFYRAMQNNILVVHTTSKDYINEEILNLIKAQHNLVEVKEISHDVKQQIASNQRQVVRQMLLSRPESGNPLWLTFVCSITAKLTRQDFLSIRQRQETDNEEQINAYLRTFIENIPSTVEEVSSYWIHKLGDVYGTTFVNEFFSIYVLGQHGWTDEDIQQITGNSLTACISLRQAIGSYILTQNDYGNWCVQSENLKKLWTESYIKGKDLQQKILDYLRRQPVQSPAWQMNIFRFSRLNGDYMNCIGLIKQDISPDPYQNFSIKDFLTLFHHNPDDGKAFVTQLIDSTNDLHILSYIHNWCTFLRSFGMGELFIGINEQFINKIENITSTGITTLDRYWVDKYNILSYTVDHYICRKDYDKVREITRHCAQSLRDNLLSMSEEAQKDLNGMKVSFFHWNYMHAICISDSRERLIHINNIRNLVKQHIIEPEGHALNNFGILLTIGIDEYNKMRNYNIAIEMELYCLKVMQSYLRYLDTTESEKKDLNDRKLHEAYDNYCLTVNELFSDIANTGCSPSQYKKYIEEAFSYARQIKGKWSVDPLAYYKMLLPYTQLIPGKQSLSTEVLLNEAIEELNISIQDRSQNIESLRMLLCFIAYKELINVEKKDHHSYYKCRLDFEAYMNTFKTTIKNNLSDFYDALIYHKYSAAKQGVLIENHVKARNEAEHCLILCRDASEANGAAYPGIVDFAKELVEKFVWENHTIGDEDIRQLITRFISQNLYEEVSYLLMKLKQINEFDLYNSGLCCLRTGLYKNAIHLYEKLLSESRHSDSFRFSVQTNLLIAYMLAGDTKGYETLYNTLCSQDKEDTDIVEINTAYTAFKENGKKYDGPIGYTL